MSRKRKKNNKSPKVKINGVAADASDKESMVINNWNRARDETAAAGEKAEDDFQWVLPEQKAEEIPEFQVLHALKGDGDIKTGKTGRNWGQWLSSARIPKKGVILSTTLAIAIGLAFGLAVWNMVINSKGEAALTDAAPAATEHKSNVVKVEAPALSLAVLQGGVFTTEEAAGQINQRLEQKGLPTQILNMDGQHFLFLGVAGDLATAKSIAAQLKEEGIDVYAKDMLIPAVGIQGTDKDAKWLTGAPSVFAAVQNTAGSAQLNGSLDDAALKTASAAIQKLKLAEPDHDGLKGMQSDLDTALKHLTAFKEKHDQDSILNTQKALLNFLQTYHGLDG